MTRLILSALNAPAFILLVAVAVAVQSSLFNSYPLLYLQPDFVLLAVIWCALRRDFAEGGILTIIFANIVEIHSGCVQGLYMIIYMSIYLLVKGAVKVFVIPNLSALTMLTMGVSIYSKLACLGVIYLLNIPSDQWTHVLTFSLPGAVMAGITGIWIYGWLEKFDFVTYKNARARQALEDEMQLDTETF